MTIVNMNITTFKVIIIVTSYIYIIESKVGVMKKMGVFIFLVAVVFEIAFAIYCIITKSNQLKTRNFIRIGGGSFVIFVLLTILTIIEWSFRYYTIAAFLFLLGVMGAVSLIRKKEGKRPYKRVRVILKATGMTVIFFMLTLSAIIFPQHTAMKTTENIRLNCNPHIHGYKTC